MKEDCFFTTEPLFVMIVSAIILPMRFAEKWDILLEHPNGPVASFMIFRLAMISVWTRWSAVLIVGTRVNLLLHTTVHIVKMFTLLAQLKVGFFKLLKANFTHFIFRQIKIIFAFYFLYTNWTGIK